MNKCTYLHMNKYEYIHTKQQRKKQNHTTTRNPPPQKTTYTNNYN